MQAQYFHEYFSDWICTYKEGAVRPVTLAKYKQTLIQLKKIAPDVTLAELDKRTYQQIINKYAETHAKQTVSDFNVQLKAAVMDMVDEGKIPYNPTRKTVIKGNARTVRGNKYLGSDECKKLLGHLELPPDKVNWDWFIFLCLKTGLRFSEALGLTPKDFDVMAQTLRVNKTFDYKCANALVDDVKTESSKRVIVLDRKTSEQFGRLLAGENMEKLIFVSNGKRVFNSTVGARLKRLCKSAEIPEISIHGLRHTHASLLFYNGVSIHSISRRLGHANIAVTQNTYIHIIKEMEEKDNEKILSVLEESF